MKGEYGELIMTHDVDDNTQPYLFGCDNQLLKQKNNYTTVITPNSVIVSARGEHFFRVLEEGGMSMILELRKNTKVEQGQIF